MPARDNVPTSPLSSRMSPGWIRYTLLLLFCLLPAAAAAVTTEQDKLTAADGEAFGLFGEAIAIAGDTALIGALVNVDGNTNQGAAYVFVRDDGQWHEQASFVHSDGAAFDNFGSAVALSDDGNTALVGAFQFNVNGSTNQGAAFIYTRDGEDWSGPVSLVAADGASSDNFGGSVALSGDGTRALVGASAANIDGVNNQGAVYVFELDDGVWSQQHKLTAANGAGGDRFGNALALSGDTLLVGAASAMVGGMVGQGVAYVFTFDGVAWNEQVELTASDGGMFDGFGSTTVLSNDTALVGAGNNSAYVFTRDGGAWSEQAKLTASDGGANSGFAGSMALSGDTALVGARSASVDNNNGQGAAYVFTRDGASWTEQTKLIASDGAAWEAFGTSVALLDDTALVGATDAEVDGNSQQGAVYVFQLEPAPSPELLWVESSTVDFCQVEVGTTSPPETMTLHNAGETEVAGLNFTGLPDGGFAADTSGCGETLPAGESCPVQLTFTPAALGPVIATLQASGAGDAEASLGLAGTGVTGEPVEHETMLLSRADGPCGDKGNDRSFFASISADGRFIVFASNATNLHPDAADSNRDIFVRDTQTDETHLVNRASGVDGEKANAISYSPSISADGRYVVFDSEASNLHPDSDDGLRDVYLRDLQTHETILVSRASGIGGAKGNANSFLASVSDDGHYVAFYSFAYNLHPDANVLQLQVYVRDVVRDETYLVSRASGNDGEVGQLASRNPVISGNGRYVAFETQSANIHPDKEDSVIPDIFVRDLETQELYLVSRASGADGEKGNGWSEHPSISADGRYVAFQSRADNLHPDDADTGLDVYVRDLQTHETILVSRAAGADGEKGDNVSQEPVISADGRFVAFRTRASNLHPDKTDAIFDIVVRDLGTHEMHLATRASGDDGVKSNADSTEPSLSGDGRYLAFYSSATNLHPDDVDGHLDVYRRDLGEPLEIVEPGELEVSPAVLDFGEVAVGVTHTGNLTVTNAAEPGAAAIELSLLEVAAGAPAFTISGDDCVLGTILAPGDSCTVEVSFEPKNQGVFAGEVSVATVDGQSETVELVGSGVPDEPPPNEIFSDRFE